jgi:LL-diaminopimelate aminotransferase
MQTAKRLETVQEYYFSQKLAEIEQLNKAGKQIINLGIGSPDLAPHPTVVQALHDAALQPQNHAYQSYKGSPVFRKAIADFYAEKYAVTLDADVEILPLIGSKEGIMHVCMSYINEGDTVLVPNPGYPTYASAATLAGGKILYYDLLSENNWLPDFEAIEKQLDGKKNCLMFVSYPHMPTGTLPTKELFENLIAFAKRNQILLVHDNPYSFIRNKNPMSIFCVEGAKEVAMELNSLSKSHNMAGWRVGFLCAAANRIKEVLKFKSNMDSGMFLPVQLAAAKALQLSNDWFADLNVIYARREKLMCALLEKLGCTIEPNQCGLFVWAKVPVQYADGYALSDKVLYAHNVFITPGGIFGSNGNGYVRVSLCQKEEVMENAIERIN